MSELTVTIDDRARLGMALLAASRWPELEQARETHAVHPHAKQTRQFAAELAATETAVAYVNDYLATGLPIPPFFMAVLRCDGATWQPQEPRPLIFDDEAFFAGLRQFAQAQDWAGFWAMHAAVWQEAQADLTAIFQKSTLPAFLSRLTGQPLVQTIAIVPNLVYPALTAVMAPTQDALYLLLPPPKAVGESPPWPYREGLDWVLAETAYQLFSHVLKDFFAQLEAERSQLLLQAAITLFLEEALGEADALAYMVRVKRQFKLPKLPLVVEELREELAAERPLTA